MDTTIGSFLISAERSRTLTAALWFRLVAVVVIAVAATFRHALPAWMREGFVLIALPLFCYNLAALLGRKQLERLLIRHPELLAIDLVISVAVLAIGGGWRNSYFFYTLTTLILFTIFLNRRGVWVASAVFIAAALIKDPAGELPAIEAFAVTNWDMRWGAALFYLCAALVFGYFDTLLSRIEHLAREKIAETQRRVTVEAHQQLALELHDGAKQMVLALLLRSRGLLRCQERNEDGLQRELEWLWRGLSYLQTELNHLVKTLRGQESATGWEVGAIIREEIQLVTALTGSHWTLEVSMEEPVFLSAQRRDALRHFLAEALMNTWKHAGVTAGEVALRQRQDGIVLDISDRGCGFDPALSGDRETVGLHSLRHRARELGGNLELDSQPDQGCRLTLRFPCPTPDA